MLNLQTILEAIDHLQSDEQKQVLRSVEKRHMELLKQPHILLTTEEQTARMSALRQAIDEFREGLSEEQLEAIFEDANSEYIEPEDLTLFSWIDELPEDER